MSFLYTSPNGVINKLDNAMLFYTEDSSIDDESRCQLIASNEGKRFVVYSGTHAEVHRESRRMEECFGFVSSILKINKIRRLKTSDNPNYQT